jgi:hypothetical protein
MHSKYNHLHAVFEKLDYESLMKLMPRDYAAHRLIADSSKVMPVPGCTDACAKPAFTSRGFSSIGFHQSEYSSQCAMGEVASNCALTSGQRWFDRSQTQSDSRPERTKDAGASTADRTPYLPRPPSNSALPMTALASGQGTLSLQASRFWHRQVSY